MSLIGDGFEEACAQAKAANPDSWRVIHRPGEPWQPYGEPVKVEVLPADQLRETVVVDDAALERATVAIREALGSNVGVNARWLADTVVAALRGQ